MANNIFDKKFKEYDKWYDENFKTFESEIKLLKPFQSYIKNNSLEIGCGSGRFAASLHIRYCLDISKNLLKLAKEKNLNTILASSEKLPFENDSFDFIGIFFSLSFFENKTLSIKESSRVLKKGGKIYILTINKNGNFYKSIKNKKNSWYGFSKPLDKRGITKLLNYYHISILYKKNLILKNQILIETNLLEPDYFMFLGEKI